MTKIRKVVIIIICSFWVKILWEFQESRHDEPYSLMIGQVQQTSTTTTTSATEVKPIVQKTISQQYIPKI